MLGSPPHTRVKNRRKKSRCLSVYPRRRAPNITFQSTLQTSANSPTEEREGGYNARRYGLPCFGASFLLSARLRLIATTTSPAAGTGAAPATLLATFILGN